MLRNATTAKPQW